ncbi:MAG: ABC transporter permease, partial [Thermotogota bacterium]
MREASYWRYAAVRVLFFILTYVLLVYVFSALLDAQLVTQVERTLSYDVNVAAHNLVASGDIQKEEYENTFQEMYRAARHARGFDLPVFHRIHLRALRILRLDFGKTGAGTLILYRHQAPVLAVIGEFATPTATLFVTAFLAQMLLGTLLGTRNASRPGSFLDRLTTFLATATMSMPPPVAALFAVLLFVYTVPIAPSTPLIFHFPTSADAVAGWLLNFMSHLALPFVTVIFLTVWGTAHNVRNLSLGVFQEDFVSSARARGIPERRVVYGHGLRAATPAIATLAATGLFTSLWGSFLVEPIFQLRGIGTLFLFAARSNDIAMLLGLLVTVTAVTQIGYLGLDLAYGRLDPRIKVGRPQLRVLLRSTSKRSQRA